MRITIVTPSYNQGNFLGETIVSVISQQGDFFLDYIIMDGGSTDNSVEIIKKYESLLERKEWPVRCRGIEYRWLSEKDRGQSDAIIRGFRMAAGDILAWLNSDDRYLPGAIQKASSFLTTHPGTCLVYGKALLGNSSGEIIGEYPSEAFDYKRLAESVILAQPAAFFRKDAFINSGGIDISLHYAMDYDLWIRMARIGQIEHLPDHLAIFTLHEESKTVSPRHALARSRECLVTVMKYYNRAPANRVYEYCSYLVSSKLPSQLAGSQFVTSICALLLFPFAYLVRNRGIALRDLKMVSWENIRKLFVLQKRT